MEGKEILAVLLLALGIILIMGLAVLL